jgi:hypothetical protein
VARAIGATSSTVPALVGEPSLALTKAALPRRPVRKATEISHAK